MKYLITESQYNKAIDMFITYQMDPHKEDRDGEDGDSIFWIKDNEVIASVEETLGDGVFYLYKTIWESISNMFSFDDEETQSAISIWLEKHYKLGNLTPILHYWKWNN